MSINHYGYYVDYIVARSNALGSNSFDESCGYTERARSSYFYKDMNPEFKTLLTECYNNLDLMLTTKHVGNEDSYNKYKELESISSQQLEKLAKQLSD